METNKTFYERRLREELRKAEAEDADGLRILHRRWAEMYRQRVAELDQQRASD